MKEIIRYMSDDGKEFDDRESCKKYEEFEQQKEQTLMNAINVISDNCTNFDKCTDGCIFYLTNLTDTTSGCFFKRYDAYKWCRFKQIKEENDL